ncbi:MAG: undecaprenyldiphospho-muramoylpentapeptide beta-N-acetylglucosaminyltransferase [Chitinophagaceae bacterium]
MGKRIIIAGGGTGGHIFPAIAVANALKKIDSSIEILFVGAKGRMEMEKVPQAGYKIEGLDIAGFNRSSLIKNIGLPFKLVKSFWQVRKIFRAFRPDAAIGVGGYSSFPVLRTAQGKGISTFILEANSFAGKSNIMLGKKATRVFAGTEGMEKFFPPEKIMVTGNPVRTAITGMKLNRAEGQRFFSLREEKTTLLVVGGSLGARSVNEAIGEGLDELLKAGLQLVWQTGKPYAETAKQQAAGKEGVWVNDFITQMEYAYAAADIVVARAGAMTVAELCVVKKPVVFVPYPYAAEDHQTANAMTLVNKKAALVVKDSEVKEKLVATVTGLAKDKVLQEEMSRNMAPLAITNADEVIAGEILKAVHE